jgi:hypothetical protein
VNPIPHGNKLSALGLLASALSRRDVGVDHTDPGIPAWTSGTVIFVDGGASLQTQLKELCVQSALLAAGSLERELVGRLARRPGLARRYLAVEGHRALAALEGILPPSMRDTIDHGIASRSASPSASLIVALSEEPIEDPPPFFGSIRVRELLAALAHAAATDSGGRHAPYRQLDKPLAELADDATEEEDFEDFASSPAGGGGWLGRWLQKALEAVRKIKQGAAPGADAPTHWSRPRIGASSLPSTAAAETVAGAFGGSRGILYPEWDIHRQAYRPDWCTVQEVEPPAELHASVEWLDGHGLRRPLARLGMGLDRVHRQAGGEDIDIDAAIEAQVERWSGGMPGENTYVAGLRRRRDLSVLVLLDVSGSVTQASPAGGSVHAQQRQAAAGLCTVLHDIGDRVALYAFHSQGRSAVHLVPVKRFDQGLDSRVMRGLHSLVPGAYSRLGAAIRHGASLLIERGGTSRRLLLVLSDGLAYDHGYEPAYGAADARQALAEARRDGVGCLCLSIGASTDAVSLRRVFGSAAHASFAAASQLGERVGPLFRSALRNAEVRRRAA